MRKVDRSAVPAPDSLTIFGGVGDKERQAAAAHYGAGRKNPFKFKAYKSKDVVEALGVLFHKKCAYCEGRFGAFGPVDIEHYRPKGGVSEDPAHCGYWWLAASWDNLLPSCVDCNRERYQHVATEGMAGLDWDVVAEVLAGKKNAFPIAGPARAGCHLDDHDAEDPLLIDPTRRDPEAHLVWSEVSDRAAQSLSIAVPRVHHGQKDLYGKSSIAIYGLNRRGLVEERTLVMLALRTQHASILDLIDMATMASGALLDRLLIRIEKEFMLFLAHRDDDKPYSRCARSFIDAQSASLLAGLHGLRQASVAAALPAHP